MLKRFLLFFSLIFAIRSSSLDSSTYANNDEIKQKHIKLNLLIDFTNKILIGDVTISFFVLINNVNKVILDINELDIFSIKKGNLNLKFSYDNTHSETLGQGLIIDLDRSYNQNEIINICISYSTTSHGDAVQFLDPELTSDPSRNMPFMLTQCESILARSLLPCQDTPSYKITVEAILTAQKDFEVLFGGKKIKKIFNENNTISHHFIQDIPIPTYLIAIASGEIVGKSIQFDYNPNISIKIWAEPSVIDCAYLTFKDDLPLYIENASKYLFDYEWGAYDIIILPKSFPFGGMENPNLTFATPALIHCYIDDKGQLVADKTQVFVAAHELAHSWTGNLVTNINWNNFWLNEGFTVFFERKIIELTNGFNARLLGSELSYPDMIDDINLFISNDQTDLTKLRLDLEKRNPDDSFSSIPYEKGYALLHYLEQSVIEDEEIFQRIFKSYILKFKNKSVVYNDFISVFNSEIENIYKERPSKLEEIKGKLKFEEWLSEEGVPMLIVNDYSNSESDDFKLEFKYLIKNQTFSDDIKNKFLKWSSLQQEGFILLIKNSEEAITTNKNIVIYLRDELNLKSNLIYNMQIRFRWIQIEFKANTYKEVISEISTFLSQIGRQYFVRTIYNSWMRIDKDEAYKGFLNNKKGYHPMVVTNIQNDFDRIKVKMANIEFLS